RRPPPAAPARRTTRPCRDRSTRNKANNTRISRPTANRPGRETGPFLAALPEYPNHGGPMRFTPIALAVSVALGSAFLSACDKTGDRAASRSSTSTSPSGSTSSPSGSASSSAGSTTSPSSPSSSSTSPSGSASGSASMSTDSKKDQASGGASSSSPSG